MRRVRTGVWIVAMLAVGGAGVAAFLTRPKVADAVESAPSQDTEHEWLVRTVAQDLGAMVWRAGGRLPDGAAPLKVRVLQPDVRSPRIEVSLLEGDQVVVGQVLQFPTHVWAPQDYEAWAKDLVRIAGVQSQGGGSDGQGARLLQELLEPTPSVLVRLDRELSQALADQMAAAGYHEDAALLLGAFGLREAAGIFADQRPTLCRMAAHLAFARALRGGEALGTTGQYAEVILSALAFRQADALASLRRLPADSDVDRAWHSALAYRITSDWRPPTAGESLFVRRERYHAMMAAYDPLEADARMAGSMDDPVTDWGRISLERLETYQQAAHLQGGLDREVEELGQVATLVRGKPLDVADVAALDAPAEGLLVAREGAFVPEILGWDDWAGAFQRHAMNFVFQTDVYTRAIRGDGDQAGRALAEAREKWGRLRLFPLVERLCAHDAAAYRQAMARVLPLASAHPELLTVRVWLQTQERPHFAALVPGLLPADRWFVGFPAGTTYDSGHRLRNLMFLRARNLAQVEALRAISPYDTDVVAQLIERKYPRKGAADIEREYGERAFFDPLVMHWMAKCCGQDQLETFRTIAKRLCPLDPRSCLALADHVVDWNLSDEAAAAAYLLAFESHPTNEYVVYDMEWLVLYLERRGDSRRALQIARAVEDTPDSRGQETLGLLFEQMGRFGEAEAILRKADDWRGRRALAAFLHRRGKHAEAASLASDVLPHGFERATGAGGPPEEGALVESVDETLREQKLLAGMVVVGLDGWRVRDTDGLHFLAKLSRDPDMELLVWDRGDYRTVRIHAPRRMLEAGLTTYGPASS